MCCSESLLSDPSKSSDYEATILFDNQSGPVTVLYLRAQSSVSSFIYVLSFGCPVSLALISLVFTKVRQGTVISLLYIQAHIFGT